MKDTEQSIGRRLQTIRDRIGRTASACGRDPASIVLIGVSKRQPVEKIRAAHAAGLRDFGENYAQELRDKRAALSDLPGIRWHFIGGMQRNKVKLVLSPQCLIHTIDRVPLLGAVEKRAAAVSLTQEVLVEVNLGEAQKAGVSVPELEPLLARFATLEYTSCCGLMVIPPPGESRIHFGALRELRDRMRSRTMPRVDLRHLSMGMSADFEAAIEEGATMVRVGTAIFGERPSPAGGM